MQTSKIITKILEINRVLGFKESFFILNRYSKNFTNGC
ncbi:hypothetical protein BG20_I1224 [Candidatus Nitrosarchaeum limnium BG20]|uniref:Uncharacterized protein n=1 Tax=Candidatus Nitrosarchaeum limnium BG20 TaxID=859192 RepID=S2E224_9ARCH|nr:hypothetical protein BG20_I1224 [Candidatus Nitrosarchaeum limnium BG20]